MRVVCVSGVDGAGKTTIVRMLACLYKRLGFRVRCRWLRWFALLSYPLYLYARLLKRTLVLQARGHTLRLRVFWVDKALRQLYPRTLLTDLLLYYLYISTVSLLGRADILLLDRCFVDALIDLVWETRDTGFLKSAPAKACLGLQKNMKTVFLVVDPKTAARRKRDIVSLKELYFKRRLYEKIGKLLQAPVIDTSDKNPLQTLASVLAKVQLF